MSKNPLLDEEFLKNLYLHRSREVFSKIIALTLEEDPVEEIQGQVTGGSISLDGTSSVRRSCNLTLVAKDLNINQYYWGLKSKFKLYIGLANNIDKQYDDIIWFPMGIYAISNFNTSQSTNSYTITITGKDKMCLLNGDLGGSLFASHDFGKEEYYENGITTLNYIPIKNIIKEAVHAYANEPWENIIINDLDDYGIELLEYRNDKSPMYLFFVDGTADNTKECENITINPDKIVYPAKRVYNSNNSFTYEITDTQGVTLEEIETTDGLRYDPRITLDLGGVDIIEPSIFCDINGLTNKIDTSKAYTIAKITAGQTCGYRLTEITYPGDLILGIGEPITAMLDKIVAMLGNFEYFYDVDGRFIFQRKATFVDKTWNNIRTGNQNSYVTTSDETYVESAAYTSPIFWTFGNSFLTTAYANTPVLNNVKNDFSIWGTKKSSDGSELPVHLRYAVDKKPTYYKTIEYTVIEKQEDGTEKEIKKGGVEWTSEIGDWSINENGQIFDTEDLDYLLTGKEDYTEEEKTNYLKQLGYRRVIRKAESLCDWREIIFQMALDYRKHNHEDDFYLKVRNTNGLDLNNQWYYPSGRTGYEQYYTDMEGFWRQLYCPPQLMNKLFPEAEDGNPVATGTWGNRANGIYYNTGAIYADSDSGVYFSDSTGIMYNMNSEFKQEYDLNGQWMNSWVKHQDINDGWNIQIIDAPETLNFWFDFLDPDKETELSKYSVPVIGDRAKSVNDNMVKAIYFRETPTALFTTDLQTVERKSGYTYLQYSPEQSSWFNVSSQGKSAVDVMQEYINLYLYCVESISITSVPIYHLQPNVKILVYDDDSKINGQYLVSRITIPLVYNGTMSVSATKNAEIIY